MMNVVKRTRIGNKHNCDKCRHSFSFSTLTSGIYCEAREGRCREINLKGYCDFFKERLFSRVEANYIFSFVSVFAPIVFVGGFMAIIYFLSR